MSHLSKTLGVCVNGNCSKSHWGAADHIKASLAGRVGETMQLQISILTGSNDLRICLEDDDWWPWLILPSYPPENTLLFSKLFREKM